MNIYIGYKLSKIAEEEKRELRPILEKIAETLENRGHKTFIMGRDVQNWSKEYVSSLNTLSRIIKNIRKYDILLAFNNSHAKSTGLIFEFLTAKLFGKKTYLFMKEGINDNLFETKANEVYRFSDIDDLVLKLEKSF